MSSRDAVEVEMGDEHLGAPLHDPPALGSSGEDGDLRPYDGATGGGGGLAAKARALYGRHRLGFLVCGMMALAVCVLAIGFAVTSSGSSGGSSGGAAGETGPGSAVRLPAGLRPLAYDLAVFPDIPARLFSGNVTVRLEVDAGSEADGLDALWFHAAPPLEVRAVSLLALPAAAGATQLDVPLGQGRAIEDNEFYLLPLDGGHRLDAGAYELRVEFGGNLSDALNGLYRSHYVDQDGHDHYIATTQFEPTDARRAFPCFDEPALKANFTVSLVRPADEAWSAVSNMPVASEKPYGGGGHTLTVFKPTPPMSTYLVAMIVCDFEKIEGETRNGVKVAVWTPADEIDQAHLALQTAIDVLPVYGDWYDYDYPLEKMDMLAIPDFAAGAMENWGCVTYRQVDLLYDNRSSSTSAKQRVAVVVAHELSHQTNGDLVTMDWWSTLYLNEAYASLMEHLGVAALRPEWRMWDQFVTGPLHGALALDSLSSTHPIEVEVTLPSEINEIFDTISYSKGASVLRMLQQFVGEDTFRSAMRAYVRAHAYGNTVSDDLWDAMADATRAAGRHLDVRAIMRGWTLQSGYPLVSLRADGTVSQRRFSLLGGEAAAGNETWDVPVSYATGDNRTGVVWLPRDGSDVRLPLDDMGDVGGFVRLNAGQWGYYRVSYADSMWPAVERELARGDASLLAPNDRAGTYDDMFNLARHGSYGYASALRALTALAGDSSYNVWSNVAGHLGYLRSRIETDEAFGDLEKLVLRVLAPALADNDQAGSWEDAGALAGDAGHVPRLRRRLMLGLAARYGHAATLRHVRDMYDVFMTNTTEFEERVVPDLRQVVWEYGVQQGGEAEWNKLWAYRQDVRRTVTEKRDILLALAYTRVPWLLNRFLHWSLDPELVRTQDAAYPIVGVARNVVGTEIAWRFLREAWPQISDSGISTARVVRGVLDHGADLARAREAEAYFQEVGAGRAERAVLQATESITQNIEWREKYLAQVASALGELAAE